MNLTERGENMKAFQQKEVVTFDGQSYEIVDRLAEIGDVVVFTGGVRTKFVEKNKPYKVWSGGSIEATIRYSDEHDGLLCVYAFDRTGGFLDRTPETVKVYAPTTRRVVQKRETQDVQRRTINCCHATQARGY